jgi:hypothetical protein
VKAKGSDPSFLGKLSDN